MNRQATVSLECRGVLAHWDQRMDELVVHLSTQGGHVKRIGLAQALGIPEHKLRVIAPDVGGGFGGKNRLMPEDIAVAALALKLGHPVRWIEDRREHLVASVHARDHFYDLTISADRDGRLIGLEGEVYIDAGAYALWPTGSFMEASMAARNLTGPYRIRHLKIDTFTVATNKAPMGPYRGVARPGACFAIERLVDEVARELDHEPIELRRRNIVTAKELPYETAAGMKLDTGDYVASLDTVAGMVDLPAIRRRQATAEPDGRVIGVGFAFYTEQSGHGQVEWMKRKSRVVPGYELANARMLPDGSVVLHVGVQNHGQGHETTLAQIAAHELGIDPARIAVRYGDTADGAVRLRHLRVALDRVRRRRGGEILARARRQDPPHRRASAADRSGRRAHRGGRRARAGRRDRLRRDRLCGQCAPGAAAGRHGAAARRDLDLRADRVRAACSPTARTRRWSPSIPTPAWSRSSTTRWRRTAAR